VDRCLGQGGHHLGQGDAPRRRVGQRALRGAAAVVGERGLLAGTAHEKLLVADGDLEALAGARLGHQVAATLEAHEAVACHPAAGAGDDEVGSRRQLKQGGAVADRPLAHDLPVGAVDALPGNLLVPARPGGVGLLVARPAVAGAEASPCPAHVGLGPCPWSAVGRRHRGGCESRSAWPRRAPRDGRAHRDRAGRRRGAARRSSCGRKRISCGTPPKWAKAARWQA